MTTRWLRLARLLLKRDDNALSWRAAAMAEVAPAVRAALLAASAARMKAQATYEAHVRGSVKRGRDACNAATELCAETWRRMTLRQCVEWMDPRRREAWRQT